MEDAQLYSLWLMPEGSVYERMVNTIARIGHQHDTPQFEPHVTLLGSVHGAQQEVLQLSEMLAQQLTPYEIELTRIEYLDEEFCCLFLRVVETDEVMSANQMARHVFGREHDSPYVPHLSLMYGDVPVEIKQQIIHELDGGLSLRFDVDRLHVFSTTLPTDRWSRLESFPLHD